MTDTFLWNEKNDILSAVSDGRLLTWYYPNAIYVDKDLMDLTKVIKVLCFLMFRNLMILVE
jgi:intraflagellar transport protein 80